MFSSLEVWHDDADRTPSAQMAADEALLRCAAVPTVRTYRWATPAATFGYSQKIADVRDRSGRLPVVRRWTGGGIVLHGNDLTVALAIPASFAPTGCKAGGIYREIHGAILRGLEEKIPDARLAQAADCRQGLACFEAPALDDIIAGGLKICGGALRRGRSGILYQGSLQYRDEVDGHAVCRALSSVLRDHRDISRVEELASRLEVEKYGTDHWNMLR